MPGNVDEVMTYYYELPLGMLNSGMGKEASTYYFVEYRSEKREGRRKK
jgi:hypothetical protein